MDQFKNDQFSPQDLLHFILIPLLRFTRHYHPPHDFYAHHCACQPIQPIWNDPYFNSLFLLHTSWTQKPTKQVNINFNSQKRSCPNWKLHGHNSALQHFSTTFILNGIALWRGKVIVYLGKVEKKSVYYMNVSCCHICYLNNITVLS